MIKISLRNDAANVHHARGGAIAAIVVFLVFTRLYALARTLKKRHFNNNRGFLFYVKYVD